MSSRSIILADECELITKGTTPSTLGLKHQDDGIPFIRAQNLVDGIVSVEADPLFIDQTTHDLLRRSKIKPSDILLSIAGTIGRAAIVPVNAEEMNCNQAVAIIRPSSRIDRHFLLHWLSSRDAVSQISKGKVTGTISNLSLGQIGSLKIVLPPLDEQRRIAAILDRAEALRRKRKQALDLVDSLSQSIFLEMFGEPGLSKRFPQASLSEIATKITDGEHQNPAFTSGGMPIVMASQVLDDGIDICEAKFVSHADGERFRRKCAPEKGDILIVGRGATIGRTSIVDTPRPFCLMGSVILLKPEAKLVDSTYLATLFKFPRIRAALYNTSSSSAQQAIYLSHLKKMTVLLPPIGDQREFVQRAEKIAVGKRICFRNSKMIETLVLSLQHRAFSAQL
jgi:type I restriction enzyme S subunit